MPGTLLGTETEPGTQISQFPALVDVTVQTQESHLTVKKPLTNGDKVLCRKTPGILRAQKGPSVVWEERGQKRGLEEVTFIL